MWVYIWLAVTAVALIVEFVTSELVSVWFVGGGLVAMLLALLGVGWFVHLPLFIVVSLILLLCFRKVAMKKFNRGTIRTNAETVIGSEFTLLSDVKFNQPGTVRINGVVWNVIGEKEDAEIPAGVKVVIKEIKGNKYIVKEIK